MTSAEIGASLRKIVEELNDLISKVENGEDTADTLAVINAPKDILDNKSKLLGDDKD